MRPLDPRRHLADNISWLESSEVSSKLAVRLVSLLDVGVSGSRWVSEAVLSWS